VSWTAFILALAGAAATSTTSAKAEATAKPGVEVLRVKRDFGKPHFDLAIDAWLDADATRLDEARLWWVNTAEQDRRKPLGPMVERMVKLRYRRGSSRSLTVTVTGDGKEFAFVVELGEAGQLHAFVAVDTDDGRHVARCRTTSARLIAHRVLGLPVGLARVSVTCKDEHGAVHKGTVRHREV
jgi:hypothetical protein